MMGIVSDQDLQKELERNGNKPVVRTPIPPGRKEGDVNVPEALRKVIAQDAIENGRESAIELAKSVGVSESSVSAYVNGSTSTASYHERNRELVTHTNQVREKIAGKARTKLLTAIRHITPEKLKAAKLTEVSAVARDMSAIVKNMEPRHSEDEDDKAAPRVNINIFAPARRQESDYKVIDVSE